MSDSRQHNAETATTPVADHLAALARRGAEAILIGDGDDAIEQDLARAGFAVSRRPAGSMAWESGAGRRTDVVVADAQPTLTIESTAQLRLLADRSDSVMLVNRGAPFRWNAHSDVLAELGLTTTHTDDAILIARRTDSLRPLLAFVHLPKTGGQSLRQMFYIEDERRVLDLDWATTPGITANVEQWRRELNANRRVDLLDSHGLRGAYPRVLGDRLVLYTTLLRHPREQFISYVRYIKHQYHTFPTGFTTRLPAGIPDMDLVDLARSMLATPDAQYREAFWFLPCPFFAFARESEPVLEHLRRFLLVGLTDRYDESLRRLGERMAHYGLQLPEVETPRMNAAPGPPGDRDELEALPDLDAFFDGPARAEVEVYDWAVAAFDAGR